MRMGGINYAKE